MTAPLPDSSPSELMTAVEVANLLSISPKTVYAWNKQGTLNAVKFQGSKTLRFRRSEVYGLVENQGEAIPSHGAVDIVDKSNKLPSSGDMKISKLNGVWVLDVSLNGRRTRRQLGASVPDALLKLGVVAPQIAEEITGENVPACAVYPNGPSFDLAVEEYLKEADSNHKESSKRRDRVTLKPILEVFGKRKLDSITKKEIYHYRQERKMIRSASSVNKEICMLNCIFKHSIEIDLTDRNPAEGIKMLKLPESKKPAINIPQLRRLLKELEKVSPTHLAIGLLASVLGLRAGEIRSLEWDKHVIEKEDGWWLLIEKTKTGKPRLEPVPKLLRETLEELKKNRRGKYIISKPDGSYFGSWRKAFSNAVKRAGLKNITTHSLRHVNASIHGDIGTNIQVAQALLGHSDPKMTLYYTHVDQATMRAATESVASKLAAD